ncbi:MAG TPA: HisA/HisF-related TIM barrel protein [Alphaproteobacteria bacterium]|nr:HisA/HisF-related TIM barrel protein [Alphaproteobacteria bacterium]
MIDLMRGEVVHARQGKREGYRPVRSVLCRGAEPARVVDGLLQLFPFRTLYVADLDAIGKRGLHLGVLRALRRAYPDLELWVDAGFADRAALKAWLAEDIGHPVIGSESVGDPELLVAAQEDCTPILSLDFDADRLRGPAPLLSAPERYWPRRVLAMNLLRVGGSDGPDLRLIVELAGRRPGCDVYAAGGVRGVEDLRRVADAGAAGALIASALHDGRLGRDELAKFA